MLLTEVTVKKDYHCFFDFLGGGHCIGFYADLFMSRCTMEWIDFLGCKYLKKHDFLSWQIFFVTSSIIWKFMRAEHSATAEGENCAYGPTLFHIKLYA